MGKLSRGRQFGIGIEYWKTTSQITEKTAQPLI